MYNLYTIYHMSIDSLVQWYRLLSLEEKVITILFEVLWFTFQIGGKSGGAEKQVSRNPKCYFYQRHICYWR